MVKHLRISSYIRKPFLIYDFATVRRNWDPPPPPIHPLASASPPLDPKGGGATFPCGEGCGT